jgi:hypothetical protein
VNRKHVKQRNKPQDPITQHEGNNKATTRLQHSEDINQEGGQKEVQASASGVNQGAKAKEEENNNHTIKEIHIIQ